jgi:microcystin-dependent protein
MAIPPFNPQQPIPNNPFYNPDADRYNLNFIGGGPLIFGNNLLVDYATGQVSIVPDGQRGTVTTITGTNGLVTVLSDVVSHAHTVTVDLVPNASLTPGSYTYPQLSVDQFGKVYSIISQPGGITSLLGTEPIYITGANPSVTVNIRLASTTNPGSVQLLDSTLSPDNKKALTANQGYLLQQQINVAGGNLADQKLGGVVNVLTGNVTVVTPDGATFPGVTVGSPLPAASSTYNGLYFYTTGTGAYTPPGGTTTSCVPNDKVLCIAGSWNVIQQGVRLVQATTTVAGISTLAVGADVQALADPSKFVTPGSLSVMVASTSQVGFVELATDLETQAFTDTTHAVTPSNLGTLQATTTTRGFVQLLDTLTSPSVVEAPTANALLLYTQGNLQKSQITAKGDLIVGYDVDQPIILSKGTNNSRLVVDNTKPTQGSLDWTVPDALASWPVGAVIWNLSTTTPVLWLPCDGRLLDGNIGSPYFDLYDIIGTTYNTGGEAPNFFRLPDLRGQFVRGWNNSGGTPGALDPGRAYASCQGSAYQQHCHGITDLGHIHPIAPIQHCHPVGDPQHCHAINSSADHRHQMFSCSVSEVGSGSPTWYDGNSNKGPRTTGTAFTGISAAASLTGITICQHLSGLTQTQVCTTGMTVTEPSPPTAPSPNETRPFNIALIPIIRYANA